MQFQRKGNGGGGPWGEGGPPDIEEIIKKIGDGFRGRFSKAPALIILLIIIIGYLFTCFYKVGVDEQGVIQRFGRHARTTQPGLHLKLPFGVEKVTKVKVKHVFKEEFGFRTTRPGVRTQYARGKIDESLMLTGDLNVALVEWIVQYRIKNPVHFLFNVSNQKKTIRDISEVVMREVVGDRSVTEVLTIGRKEVGAVSKERLQKIYDYYQMGIHIENIILQDVNPPDPVKPSFNEVNEAKQEKEEMINQAWEEYNKAIPAARGEAEKTIREAEGYATKRINRANGDADRFKAIWKEYAGAKDVTRRRMYLESMSEVLAGVDKKYIIDPEHRGLIQFLPLEERREVKK